MIIWFTGQPGSGKTTLANELILNLKRDFPDKKLINIDGDDLRSISKNKDYSKEGRIKNDDWLLGLEFQTEIWYGVGNMQINHVGFTME